MPDLPKPHTESEMAQLIIVDKTNENLRILLNSLYLQSQRLKLSGNLVACSNIDRELRENTRQMQYNADFIAFLKRRIEDLNKS